MRNRNGAQGRDRTTDTVIFSHVLYQLSYLGAEHRRAGGLVKARGYRGSVSGCPDKAESQPLQALQAYPAAATALRKRSLSSTPSLEGSTRVGSSAAMRTRANSVSRNEPSRAASVSREA